MATTCKDLSERMSVAVLRANFQMGAGNLCRLAIPKGLLSLDGYGVAVQHSVNVPMSDTQPLFVSERMLVQYSTICITGSAPLAFRVTLVCIPAPHRPGNGNSCHACSIPLCLSHAFIHPESTKRQVSLWINHGKYVGLLHANMVDGCTTPEVVMLLR